MVPSYKTNVDLSDRSFRDFLLGFSSSDWLSLSTVERCQLITLVQVAFVQITTEYDPRMDEAIGALTDALVHFEAAVTGPSFFP